MPDTVVPSDRINPNLPLFQAFGLTAKESDDVFFGLTEDILHAKVSVAECLCAIQEHKKWNDKQKLWAAYHLQNEFMIKAGVPRILIEQLTGGIRGLR